MDIIADLMKQVATGDNLSLISKSVGSDEKSVQSALGMGIPMIMGSMAQTAQTPGGADMITSMMGQMGGSNPIDNLGGFLGSSAASGGSGMAHSILGSQMAPISNAIAQKTGLPPAVVEKILAIATPMIMGYVTKSMGGKQVDQQGLASLLGDQSKMAMQSSPDASRLAERVLGSQKDAAGVPGVLKKFPGK